MCFNPFSRYLFFLYVLLDGLTPHLCAQNQQSLALAFQQLSQHTGTNIVYAQSYVQGKVTNCMPRQPLRLALNCMLRGTNLKSQQISPSQWVIVPMEILPIIESRNFFDEKPAVKSESFQIRGKIRDAITGEILVGATVHIPLLATGAATNEKGIFELKNLPQGTFEAQVRYMGYQSETVSIHTESPLYVIRLTPQPIDIEELKVEEIRGKNLDIGAFMISEMDLLHKIRALTDADFIALMQQSSNVLMTGEFGGDLIVRGGESDQNLYLIDGVPVYQPGGRNLRFSAFQPDLMQYVKFYKGISPAELGGRLASVVQAELKDGLGTSINHQLLVGNTQVRLNSEIPIGQKMGILFSGRQSLVHRFESVKSALPSQYRFSFGDLNGKVTYLPALGHRLEAFFYQSQDAFQLNSTEAQEDLLIPAGFDWKGYETHRANRNRLFSMRYRFVKGQKQSFSGQIYQTGYQYTESNLYQLTNEIGTAFNLDLGGNLQALAENPTDTYYGKVRSTGFRFAHEYFPNNNTRVIMGLEGTQMALQSFRLRQQGGEGFISEEELLSREGEEYLFYIGIAQKLDDKLALQLGVRSGAFTDNLYAAPSGSFTYTPHKYITIKASMGKQTQHIHRIQDRFGVLLHPVTHLFERIGMIFITPSSGYLSSLAVETKFNPRSSLETEAYYRVFNDVPISTNPYQFREGWERSWIENWNNPTPYVLGKSESKGIEFRFLHQYKTSKFNIHYTLSKSQYFSQNKWIPARYDAPHNMRMDYHIHNKSFLGGVSMEARTGYPSTSSPRLPTYKRIDLVGGYQFRFRKTQNEMSLRVFNVLNWNNTLDQVLPTGARIPENVQGSTRQFFVHFKTKF